MYTVNLDGYSCKSFSVSVYLIGKECDKLSIRPPLPLPSCEVYDCVFFVADNIYLLYMILLYRYS